MKRRSLILATPVLLGAPAISWAQPAFPAKPIRYIVPVAAGGGSDMVGRTVTERWGNLLKQPFIVDNQAGGGGVIACQTTARAAPDGYTLMQGYVATHGTSPATRKLPYDAIKDFTPIGMIGGTPNVLVVNAALPVKNIKEFIALAKANPDKLTYASSGSLGAPHLAGELLNLLAKVKTMHIPYKGNGPAAIAVMSGETTMMFGTGPSVVPHAHTGKLRMLATTGPKRTLPDLPAMNEILPGYDVTQWYGLLLPAGAPKEVIERLHKEIVRAIANPKIAQLYTNLGTQPLTNTPEEFLAFIKAEKDKWGKVIQTANIKAD